MSCNECGHKEYKQLDNDYRRCLKCLACYKYEFIKNKRLEEYFEEPDLWWEQPTETIELTERDSDLFLGNLQERFRLARKLSDEVKPGVTEEWDD